MSSPCGKPSSTSGWVKKIRHSIGCNAPMKTVRCGWFISRSIRFSTPCARTRDLPSCSTAWDCHVKENCLPLRLVHLDDEISNLLSRFDEELMRYSSGNVDHVSGGDLLLHAVL